MTEKWLQDILDDIDDDDVPWSPGREADDVDETTRRGAMLFEDEVAARARLASLERQLKETEGRLKEVTFLEQAREDEAAAVADHVHCDLCKVQIKHGETVVGEVRSWRFSDVVPDTVDSAWARMVRFPTVMAKISQIMADLAGRAHSGRNRMLEKCV